jgi:hypothetical protein
MSKHGNQMSKKFEEQERQRRERLGKTTEIPATKKETKEKPTERFDLSNGARA